MKKIVLLSLILLTSSHKLFCMESDNQPVTREKRALIGTIDNPATMAVSSSKRTSYSPKNDALAHIAIHGIDSSTDVSEAISFANAVLSTRKRGYLSEHKALVCINQIHSLYPSVDPLEIAARLGTAGCVTLLKKALRHPAQKLKATQILSNNVEPKRKLLILSFIKAELPFPAIVDRIPLIHHGRHNPLMTALLIQAGADVNAMNENVNKSALFFEASKNNVDCMIHLLCAGADMNSRSMAETHDSRSSGADDIYAVGLTPLSAALTLGHLWAALTLINAGADVNIPDIPTGNTPLMKACIPDLVKLLLQQGADIIMRNAEGKSAREIALNHLIQECLKQTPDQGKIQSLQKIIEILRNEELRCLAKPIQ